jgi:hypothetical protein
MKSSTKPRSGNPNPVKGRMAQRQQMLPAPGTVLELQKRLWHVIDEMTGRVDKETPIQDLTRLAHALAQTSAAYLKALDVGEFEARLQAFEKELHELRQAAGRPASTGPRPQATVN